MKSIFLILGMTFSAAVLSDATVFGMHLGITTEGQLSEMYEVHSEGINKYTKGNMYSIPVKEIDFSGLQKIIVVFDEGKVLVGVFASFHKNKFDYLNSALSNKYQLVSKEIPFVGNKRAKYKDGNTEIELNSPHMNFSMSMEYLQSDFIRAINRISSSDRKQKKNREASQL